MEVIRGGREHNTVLRFWAGAEVIVCLYFGFVTADMLHDIRGRISQMFIREEKKEPSRLYDFIEEGLRK